MKEILKARYREKLKLDDAVLLTAKVALRISRKPEDVLTPLD